MDTHWLPDAIEPDYWNIVFHPSQTRTARILLGRFQHVSAFTYLAGFRGWMLYDVQWGGVRIAMFANLDALVAYTRDCMVVKFNRQYQHMSLLTRFGFYCVPAVKHLIGLSCVAVRPDALYRAIINNGGEIINEPERPAAAAARSDAAAGAGAGAG